MRKIYKLLLVVLLCFIPLLVSCGKTNYVGRYYCYKYYNKENSYIELRDENVAVMVNNGRLVKGIYSVDDHNITIELYKSEYEGFIFEGTINDGIIRLNENDESEVYTLDGKYDPDKAKNEEIINGFKKLTGFTYDFTETKAKNNSVINKYKLTENNKNKGILVVLKGRYEQGEYELLVSIDENRRIRLVKVLNYYGVSDIAPVIDEWINSNFDSSIKESNLDYIRPCSATLSSNFIKSLVKIAFTELE